MSGTPAPAHRPDGAARARQQARPARVLHLLHSWNDRAIAAITAVQAEATARRGFEVSVVAATATQGSPDVAEDVRVVVLSQAAARTLSTLPGLARALRSLRPDVVFAHGNGPVRSAILAVRAVAPRPILVGIEHNHYSSYDWDFKAARDRVNQVLLPRADLMVGVSPGIVEDLAATFPALRGRLAMVPEPLTRWEAIDALIAAEAPHPWFDEDEVPVITNVGHLHARKDQHTLIRAFAHLRTLLRPRPVRLAIIGIDTSSYADAARELAEDLGVAGDVVFLGQQANPLAFVARSAAFALSSRNEGMPVSLLEALAAGTPAVSTDCPSGPRWLFEDETCGLLAPVGDHIALGGQLARVLEDPALADRLRAAGRRRAAGFSPDRIAEQQLALVTLA